MIKYTGNKNLANDHQRENLTSRYGDKFSELRNEFAIRCWQQRTFKKGVTKGNRRYRKSS